MEMNRDDTTMIPAKPFYLLRHGETEHNVSKITAGGHTDSQLTEWGRAQAHKLGDVIHKLEVKPSRIFHSPMTRARDTANFVNKRLNLLMHEVDDLREHLVGEWEGIPWEDAFPKLKANIRPKGGENKDDFSMRIRKTVTDILTGNEEDPVMIVAHGGTFFSLLHLYERDYEGHVDNCHLHYFEPYPAHEEFPWQIWQFDIEEENLRKSSAPFCGTTDITKRS